jgi:hypothetical protein
MQSDLVITLVLHHERRRRGGRGELPKKCPLCVLNLVFSASQSDAPVPHVRRVEPKSACWRYKPEHSSDSYVILRDLFGLDVFWSLNGTFCERARLLSVQNKGTLRNIELTRRQHAPKIPTGHARSNPFEAFVVTRTMGNANKATTLLPDHIDEGRKE